ncbi:MAG: acyl--CoA ligase [Deltaproteobacteria bacterium]|nr:acyl--CoA ligase [Deltaproteobacteria bacterium]
MNIVELIRKETLSFQDKTALIQCDDKILYQELLAKITQAADELTKNGLKKGDRVGFLCEDSIDYIIVCLAVLSLSAVIVPVPDSCSQAEIDELVCRIDLNFFIFGKAESSTESYSNKSRSIFDGIVGTKKFWIYKRRAGNNVPQEYHDLNPAFIRFTSGTTGDSKGVLLSHETIVQRTDAANKALNVTSDDIVIWMLSMSFHFVVTILLFLRQGATIIICSGSFPDSLRQGLQNNRGTFIYASPFHYRMMIKSDLFPPATFSCFRLAVSTAMRLSGSTAVDFYKKFGLELSQAYGLIEIGLPFINNSKNSDTRESTGKILPDYMVRIANRNKEGVGEISIKGKGIFDAYFSPWRSRSQVAPNGWFETGDLGRLDKDGFLFLVGRKKNIINFTGMKIFPYEVESVINQYHGVQESLVYGTPHNIYGELPCARIVLKNAAANNFDLGELRKFCYQNLASYKVPKDFILVKKLDKTASGKLKRKH